MRRVDDNPEIFEAKRAKEKFDHIWKAVTTAAIVSLCAIIGYVGNRAINAFDEMSKTQVLHASQILAQAHEIKSISEDITVLKAEMKGAATRVETLEALKRIEQQLTIAQLQGRTGQAKNALRSAISNEIGNTESNIFFNRSPR